MRVGCFFMCTHMLFLVCMHLWPWDRHMWGCMFDAFLMFTHTWTWGRHTWGCALDVFCVHAHVDMGQTHMGMHV